MNCFVKRADVNYIFLKIKKLHARKYEMLIRLLLLLMTLPIVAAEAATKYLDYPLRPITDHSIHTTADGLAVAVDPVRDEDALEHYLGEDMVKKGFLPVHVAIQNVSDDKIFLFFISDLAYAIGTAAERTVEELDEIPGHSGAGIAAATVTSGALLIPLGFVVAHVLFRSAENVSHNLAKKVLRSQSIAPGEIIHGFVFIPIEKRNREQKVRLRLRATQLGNAEPLDYEFVF